MAAKLKIGIILDTSLDTNEGVPQYVAAIGEWLRSQGHDVHYLVGETKTRQLPNIHSLSRNIGVQFNGNRTTIPLPTSRRKLRRFMQQHHFDVLHVQTPHHPLMAQPLILAAASDTAVLATFHILPYGWMSRIGTKLLGIWLRPSLKRIDKMLAVSTAAKQFEETSFGLSAEVLPNVVDFKRFHVAKPRPEYKDRLTILFLGRLVPRKGCRLLLEALAALKDETDLPPYHTVICGRGPLEKQLRLYAQEHQLDVEFTGYVSEEDKPGYYASADIAVFPSSAGESFGIVLLEAMASGKSAVLAGDNPGYRSVMTPQPDLLFDPNDATELAAKLAELLRDSSRRKVFQEWSSEYAQTFDIVVIGRKLVDQYNQALRKRRKL